MKLLSSIVALSLQKRHISAMALCGSHEISAVIKSIYSASPKTVLSLAVTGGGMQAIPLFLTVPGASSCILSATVPYARAASDKFVSDNSYIIDQPLGCNKDSTLHLAKTAYLQACDIVLRGEGSSFPTATQSVDGISSIVGVACTAALVSSTPKKGAHRCFVAVYSSTATGGQGTVHSLTLQKGLRDRLGEDLVCSRLVVDAVAAHVAVPLLPDSMLHTAVLSNTKVDTPDDTATREVVEIDVQLPADALDNIYQRRSKHALFFNKPALATNTTLTGQPSTEFLCMENATMPEGTLVYPGSFNPLHEGHLALVRAELSRLEELHRIKTAGEAKSEPFKAPLVVFEIGALNADKPPLPREEIMRRLQQFERVSNPLFAAMGVTNFAVSITSEPLFVGKAGIFKGCSFLIGADTMIRLVNNKYYADKVPSDLSAPVMKDSERRRTTNMIAALSQIAANRCRFIVGGRVKTTTASAADGVSAAVTTFETCSTIMQLPYSEVIGATASTAVSTAGAEEAETVAEVLPRSIADMFVGLSEQQFRLDLSSTEIRNRAAALTSGV